MTDLTSTWISCDEQMPPYDIPLILYLPEWGIMSFGWCAQGPADTSQFWVDNGDMVVSANCVSHWQVCNILPPNTKLNSSKE